MASKRSVTTANIQANHFLYRMGDNHDGMHFYGMVNGKFDPNQSNRALLAINHEYTNENLHPMGFFTQEDNNAAPIYRKNALLWMCVAMLTLMA